MKYQSSIGLIDREGNYYECGFGDHERLATRLLSVKGYSSEFSSCDCDEPLDFLIGIKNWGIRHNPDLGPVEFYCERPNDLMLKANDDIEEYFKYGI